MAAASAQSSAAKKRTRERPLLNPVRSPKRPIKKHRPKQAETNPNCHFKLRFRTRQVARPSSREQQRIILHNTHKTPAKHTKNHKNEGFHSPQTGQSQGHRAAVASPAAAIRQSAHNSQRKKRSPPSQCGQNTRNGRWPLACVLRWYVVRREISDDCLCWSIYSYMRLAEYTGPSARSEICGDRENRTEENWRTNRRSACELGLVPASRTYPGVGRSVGREDRSPQWGVVHDEHTPV